MTIETQGRQVLKPPTAIASRNPLIEEWIVETCKTCGYPELAGRLQSILFGTRFSGLDRNVANR